MLNYDYLNKIDIDKSYLDIMHSDTLFLMKFYEIYCENEKNNNYNLSIFKMLALFADYGLESLIILDMINYKIVDDTELTYGIHHNIINFINLYINILEKGFNEKINLKYIDEL